MGIWCGRELTCMYCFETTELEPVYDPSLKLKKNVHEGQHRLLL
jgi:hypothetical protein